MSHSAMSIAESAYIAGPLRPTPPRLRCASSTSALIVDGSLPTNIWPMNESIAAFVAVKMRWPNPSPHPLTPSSVSTRTSSVSMLVRARPPCFGMTEPSICIGMFITIVSILVIFIFKSSRIDLARQPRRLHHPRPPVVLGLHELHRFFRRRGLRLGALAAQLLVERREVE